MIRTRSLQLLVIAILVGSVGSIVAADTATQSGATISNVTVTPSDPAPGEEVTVETTITNQGGSDGAVTVRSVSVRKTVTEDVEAETDDISEIQPNGSVTVPVSLTFDQTGEQRLTVRVVVRDSNGDTQVYRHPVYVTVEEPDDVNLQFNTNEAVTGGTAVTVTAANSRADAISNVELELSGDGHVATAERVTAAIPASTDQTFEYDVTFDTVGTKTLTGNITYRIADGTTRTISESTTLTVTKPTDVPLSFSTTDAVAGDDSPINVTVANGRANRITGVSVTLDGAASIDNPDRTRGALESGAEHSFPFDVTFDEVGTHSLTAEVGYTTADGQTRTTETSVPVDVVEPNVEANLSVQDNGTATTVDVQNFGNSVLADVEVTATANGTVLARQQLPDIDASEDQAAVFDIDDSVGDAVTFTATYESVGETYETTATADVRDEVLGEIRLTGIETMRMGPSVMIDGDAANVGSTDAESVLIGAGSTDGETAAGSANEYFVGTIEASEFATFELTAEASPGATSIPVEITYIVDGDRTTTIQQVAIPSANASGSPGDMPGASGPAEQAPPDGSGPSGPSGSQSGGLPLTAIGAVVAIGLIGAVAIVVRRWRNQ